MTLENPQVYRDFRVIGSVTYPYVERVYPRDDDLGGADVFIRFITQTEYSFFSSVLAHVESNKAMPNYIVLLHVFVLDLGVKCLFT